MTVDPRACGGKRAYPSEIDAEAMRRRRWFEARTAVRVYECPDCRLFHLTHVDAVPPVSARFGPPAPNRHERAHRKRMQKLRRKR